MKKLIGIFFLALIANFIYSQNPLTGVDHIMYTNKESLPLVDQFGYILKYPEGHKTYRVFAYLDDENSYITSVTGSPELEMYIGTDTPDGYVWNFGGTGMTGAMIIEFALEVYHGEIQLYDSYVTINSETDETPFYGADVGFYGEGTNVDKNTYWGGSNYSDIENPDFIMTDAFWGTAGAVTLNNYGIGPDFRVMLAQITTTAEDIHYGLNVIAFSDEPTNGGEVWINYWDPSGIGSTCMNEVDGSGIGLLYPACDTNGCMDPLGCNFDALATCYGLCTYPGCTDPLSCNYDGMAGCDDGSCFGHRGCMNELACNYDSLADCDDQSCLTTYFGCTDPTACNYNEFSICDSGLCTYGIQGCMDSEACNYDATATCNWSCNYEGCTNPLACNYSNTACADDGSCYGLQGCTDPEASNYDSLATCEVYAICIYLGCTDPDAVNYSFLADEDDGSCTFGVHGFVFEDLNENGIKEPLEIGISNIEVAIPELGLSTMTSITGYYSFGAIDPGTYLVEVNNDINWNNVTNSSNTVEVLCNLSTYVNFGLSVSGLGFSSFEMFPGWTNYWYLDCANGGPVSLLLYNNGTLDLNCSISLTWEEEYLVNEEYFLINQITQNRGLFQWDINPINVDSFEFHGVFFLEPGLDNIGEYINYSFEIEFTDFNGEPTYTEVYSDSILIACAYDPNDKRCEPEGYEEEHFILATDSLEYIVNFQNTGNLPAQLVIVKDTINDLLDLSTFEVIHSSHPMEAFIDLSSREIQFVFENINLPDSISNEEESHGYVLYRIFPFDDTSPGEVIENKAFIYFDENPPIITNTTWHTIYECTEISLFNPTLENTCVGETIVFENIQEYIVDYYWEYNGVPLGQESIQEITFEEVGDNEVMLFVSNPLCESLTELFLEVFIIPEASLTDYGALLTAEAANAYQWYFNGEEIEGATQQSYTAEESGDYSVEVWSEAGCSDLSQAITITIIGINELSIQEVKCYPNPIVDQSVLHFSYPDKYEVFLYDNVGKMVRGYGTITTDQLIIEKNDLSSGIYYIWIQKGTNIYKLSIEVQ